MTFKKLNYFFVYNTINKEESFEKQLKTNTAIVKSPKNTKIIQI